MKNKRYEGHIDQLDFNRIYLYVNHLKKGEYELVIIHKNKVLKSTHFTKE